MAEQATKKKAPAKKKAPQKPAEPNAPQGAENGGENSAEQKPQAQTPEPKKAATVKSASVHDLNLKLAVGTSERKMAKHARFFRFQEKTELTCLDGEVRTIPAGQFYVRSGSGDDPREEVLTEAKFRDHWTPAR